MWEKIRRFWLDLPIGRKQLFVIAGILSVVAITTLLIALLLFSAAKTYDEVMVHWMDQWISSQELKDLIYARVNSGLLFVLTGKEEHLHRFNRLGDEYQKRLAVLEYIVTENELYVRRAGISREQADEIRNFLYDHIPHDLLKFKEFVETSQDWDFRLRNLVLPVSAAGNREDAKQNLKELEPLTTELVQMVDEVSEIMTRNMKKLGRTMASEARDALLATGVLALLVILVTMVFSWILTQSITRPITSLYLGTKRLAKGDLDYRVEIQSKDELGQLGQAFNRMAGKLRELIDQLNETNRQLKNESRKAKQAARLKSEFLATMSHELRTPLNGIIGFAEALQEQYFGELNPKQKEYLAHIAGNGKHLLHLINEILDLSKIEAGKMELKLQAVEAAPFFAETLMVIKERAKAQGLSLAFENRSRAETVMLDPVRVKQIMHNLLSNAVKFTPRGGQVGVRLEQDGQNLIISVWDTGIGIPEDRLERIFEPFYQGESHYDRRFEGTGLGLALTRRLVSLHGGTIAAKSSPGKGSVFTFTLPLSPERIREQTASSEKAADATNLFAIDPGTVWVVGGNPDLLEPIRQRFPRYSFQQFPLEQMESRWAAADRYPRFVLLLYQKGWETGPVSSQEWFNGLKDLGIPLFVFASGPLSLQEKGALFRVADEVWHGSLEEHLKNWLDQEGGGG